MNKVMMRMNKFRKKILLRDKEGNQMIMVMKRICKWHHLTILLAPKMKLLRKNLKKARKIRNLKKHKKSKKDKSESEGELEEDVEYDSEEEDEVMMRKRLIQDSDDEGKLMTGQ